MSITDTMFTGLVDLLAQQLGGRALACSDDFFAEMGNLVKPGRGVFLPDEYTDRGKWMDGWESRRRRGGADHDWCILKLGVPGKVKALDIDTNHFLGNHPPYAAVDALFAPDATAQDLIDGDWQEILPQSPLKAGSQNIFVAPTEGAVSHIRLRIFPDGGVARLRVYGDVVTDWRLTEDREKTVVMVRPNEVDLVSLRNGGKALACSDMFFSPMENLILPGSAANMGGGWETRRKRTPGHDWIVLEFGARGTVTMAVLDTQFFKGNFPESASIEVIDAPGARITDLIASDAWKTLVNRTPMESHKRFHFRDELEDTGPATHVRVNTFPDGGLSRLRLYGIRE